MNPFKHLLFWSGTAVLFLVFMFVFSDVLLPFVLGIVIAYLLNPINVLLGKNKVPRLFATLIILFLFFTTVAIVIALIAPILYRETLDLARSMPGYIESLREMIDPYVERIRQSLGAEEINESLSEAVQNNIGNALNAGASLFGSLLIGGQALFGLVYLLVVTPIVAFFMMNEWEALTNWVDKILPRHNYQQIKLLLHDIDRALAGFIRGQLMVALILGSMYAIALAIAGLNYGFLIGLMAGVLSIIPLVGSTVGLVVAVVVAWFQTGDLVFMAIVAAIFGVGQFLEGNFITPRLVGSSVGLHPLWVLFAITAGGTLYGIVGMLVAVPLAAIIGVLVSFALEKYRKSPYYGRSSDSADLISESEQID